MKQASLICALVWSVLFLTSGCGGGGYTDIVGPILLISEAKSMVIDQFYINGGLDDEYASEGEFSVYLRDQATGQDVACVTAEDGMEMLSIPAVYYGGLAVPLREVQADHPSSLARFQVIFVEQDSEGCPNPIDADDDIAGTSAEFTFDGLLNQTIWATNGRAAVVLRSKDEDGGRIGSMAPALQEVLAIDKLYFDNGSEGQEEARYYLFADRLENGESIYQCQVDDALMASIRYGGIIYATLDFPISCFEATDPDFADIVVRISLFIQRQDGPALIGETEAKPIGELIGEKVEFTNGRGFVSFRSVVPGPFQASVVRLAELADLVVTALEYELAPSYDPTVELHVTDAEGDYIIACAGQDQGLVGVDTPGSYNNLNAQFVSADGQRELFGWDGIRIRLVDRTDGLTCPEPLAAQPTVLAATASLGSANLGAGLVSFSNGAGSVALAMDSGD